MRIVHTADWHLGRIFYGARLTEDQAWMLEELFALLGEVKAECLLVCGDVYDRAVPPVEAVELLDDFLSRISSDLRIPVIVLPGNHDSPERIRFASRLLEKKGLHIAGSLRAEPEPVVLHDRHGEVLFYALPFLEPAHARSVFGRTDLHTHADAMGAVIGAIKSGIPDGKRTVLCAHCFAEGGAESESERPVSIGGAESVPVSLFEGFEYVALGHLHRPQECSKPTVRYPGSLLQYSFSESDHDKFFHVVDLDERGGCTVEKIITHPKRKLRKIRGYFDSVLKNGPEDPAGGDYLHVELLDLNPVYEAMRRLREFYPNLLHIERKAVTEAIGDAVRIDHRKTGPVELFSAFYEQTTGNSLSSEQKTAFESVLESMEKQEVPV